MTKCALRNPLSLTKDIKAVEIFTPDGDLTATADTGRKSL